MYFSLFLCPLGYWDSNIIAREEVVGWGHSVGQVLAVQARGLEFRSQHRYKSQGPQRTPVTPECVWQGGRVGVGLRGLLPSKLQVHHQISHMQTWMSTFESTHMYITYRVKVLNGSSQRKRKASNQETKRREKNYGNQESIKLQGSKRTLKFKGLHLKVSNAFCGTFC